MNERYMPLAATIVVFLAIYVFGAISYNNFLSTLVFGDLLTDNAFVIIAAIGATFVILSGGIDLSVGSMIGFVSVAMAALDGHGWHPLLSALLMVGFGAVFGGAMGALIDACEIQPFILTLAAMFLLRGLCFVITLDSLPISHPFVGVFSDWRIPLPGDGRLSASALLMLVALAVAIALAHFTRFGANVYAIGGDRNSARLMGAPIRRTMVQVYALGGFYGALAGVAYAFYTGSGYPLAAVGVELDAIAAVVLGGTLLTGGVGYVAGTLFGGLIQGTIQTLITFDGRLTSWWTKIVIGALLFFFITAQRSIMRSTALMRRTA
jgi:ribose/xylose/arabinose/galactoside ABC-type transport system permease subunit